MAGTAAEVADELKTGMIAAGEAADVADQAAAALERDFNPDTIAESVDAMKTATPAEIKVELEVNYKGVQTFIRIQDTTATLTKDLSASAKSGVINTTSLE